MLTAPREREGLGRVVGLAISPAAGLPATSRPTRRLPRPLGRPAQPHLSVPTPSAAFPPQGADAGPSTSLPCGVRVQPSPYFQFRPQPVSCSFAFGNFDT